MTVAGNVRNLLRKSHAGGCDAGVAIPEEIWLDLADGTLRCLDRNPPGVPVTGGPRPAGFSRHARLAANSGRVNGLAAAAPSFRTSRPQGP